MTPPRTTHPARRPWRPAPVVAALLALLAAALVPGGGAPAAAQGATLAGVVRAGTTPLAGATVTLRASGPTGAPPATLATTTAGTDGAYSLAYDAPTDPDTVLHLTAVSATDEAVTLASVLGTPPVGVEAAITERTTVAIAYGLAQHTDAGVVSGTAPGLPNAAGMAANLADPRDGSVGQVLASAPNGSETSTLAAFGSLANMVTACAEIPAQCDVLRDLATPPGGARPADTFQAIGDLARSPGRTPAQGAGLLAVSQAGSRPNQPALSTPPDAWTLALRFDGDGRSLDGPGNFAVDHEGNIWTLNNYEYGADPTVPVCGSDMLMKFDPTGRYVPGSPFTGGGLSGAGFGIDIDPFGQVWVANYGFAAPPPGCPEDRQPPHNSLSLFTLDGTALSPDDGGFTQGGLDWPQGLASDDRGTVWVANCSSGTVTQLPDGDPTRARELTGLGLEEAFGVTVNPTSGEVFVTGLMSENVARLGPDGTPVDGSPIEGPFSRPMGIVTDSTGHMWVANSGEIDLPCPDGGDLGPGGGSSTLLAPDGRPLLQTDVGAGGMTVPWGIAVDGDDNVWVANFGQRRLSHLCGTDPSTCPPGVGTGDAISPDGTGYGFDGLTRSTGLTVDQAGNVWVTNNWKEVPIQTNPGGYEVVAYVGIAPPVDVPAPRDRPDPPPGPGPGPGPGPDPGRDPGPAPPAVPLSREARFTG